MNGYYSGGICTNCHHPQPVGGGTDATALPPGSMLHNQYYIGEPIGHGGFGITYIAWDTKNQFRVAIKELFPARELIRDENRRTTRVIPGREASFRKVLDCFQREAKMLIKLQSQEGVVHLYHFFEENNTAYYVMEFLDGEDLRNYLKRTGPMSWQTFSPFLFTILNALDQLHSIGLIHRDISPDNIFMTRDGQVRLIDFGSVRAYQGADHFTTFVKHSFAPWEQYLSEGKQGPWTDIYAMCVTAYYVLSGILPPPAPQRRMGEPTKPLEQVCPSIPPHVARAIAKGMAVDMNQRCQNVQELLCMLYPNARSGSRSTPAPAPSPVPPPPNFGAGKSSFASTIPAPVRPQPPKPPQAVPSSSPSPAVQPPDTRNSGILGWFSNLFSGSKKPPAPTASVNVVTITCKSGVFKDKSWVIAPNSYFRIGRNPGSEITYPGSTQGVSREQCVLFLSPQNGLMVRDDHSSCGTYLIFPDRQVKLERNQWYSAGSCWLCFGQQEQYWIQ